MSGQEGLRVVVRIPLGSRAGGMPSEGVVRADVAAFEAYAGAVAAEIGTYAVDVDSVAGDGDCAISSVYLHGLDPFACGTRGIAGILDALRGVFGLAPDAEVLADVLPGSLDAAKLDAFRCAGGTRVVVTMLTSQGAEVKALARPCDASDVRNTFELLTKEGFPEYGAALGFGLPRQTPASFAASLHDAYFYAPEFVELRPWGRGADRWPEGAEAAPPLEARARMLEEAERFLVPYAYRRETDLLFARRGHAPRALSPKAGDVIELGLGGVSVFRGALTRNTSDLGVYLSSSSDPAAVCESAGELDDRQASLIRAARGLCSTDGAADKEAVAHAEEFARLASEGVAVKDGGVWRLSRKAFAAPIDPLAYILRPAR